MKGAASGGQIALLRLLQLASPALPIGAYAYSRGLESAVHFGWVSSERDAACWISGTLERSLATLEGPVFLRMHRAFSVDDLEAVTYWNAFLSATRESRELALEDRQLGRALSRVLVEQGVEHAAAWSKHGGYATLFALATAHWKVDAISGLSAFLFAFVENQVSCAVKLVPLGQTAGQRILSGLLPDIDRLAHAAPALEDGELGSFTPRVALGSALHETQYTRLFRS